jgi:hypothetical protein
MALEINIINQIISKRIKYGRKEGGGREGREGREGRGEERERREESTRLEDCNHN